MKHNKQVVSLRDMTYCCGCHLKEECIKLCPTHFVIFEELLIGQEYTQGGWHNMPQDAYNKIVHCLNVEEEERRGVKMEKDKLYYTRFAGHNPDEVNKDICKTCKKEVI